MSQASRTSRHFGSVTSNALSLKKANVIQTTSITSGVTLTTQAGSITTVNATNATGASTQFTVTDLSVTENSLILADIMNYAGSTGFPSVYVDNVTTGSFKVIVHNHSEAVSLNGALKISYLIL